MAIVHSRSMPKLIIVKEDGKFDEVYLSDVTLVDKDEVDLIGMKVYEVPSVFKEYIIKK